MPVLTRLLAHAVPLLALVSVAVIGLGLFRHSPTGLPFYWQPDVLTDLVLWVAGTTAVAALLRWKAERHAALLLTGLLTLHFMVATGLLASLSTLLFFGACTLVGRCFAQWLLSDDEVPLVASLCIGLGLYLALFGLLIHFPVNSRALYLSLLLTPFAVVLLTGKASHYGQRLWQRVDLMGHAIQRSSYWQWILLLVVLGYVARHAFYPSLAYDDNALHLRLWTELTFLRRAAFNVESQVWVVAPFAVDLLHAVISVIAAADARAPLNLLLLVVLLQQTWQLLGHFLSSSTHKTLLLLLFASTPMLGHLLLTLQTEFMLALLSTIALNLVLDMPARWLSSHTLALLAIAALCCAIKLPGALLGLLLLASALWKLLTARSDTLLQHLNARIMLLVLFYIAVLAIVAFNSYLTAWRLTGNPVFPLYNAVFQSPLYELENFEDARWIKGFSLANYWNMFFTTSEYFEAFDFVAGFQYLLLLPLALLAFWHLPARRQYLLVLLPMLGFGLVMFANTQYWRYLFPVVPLASVLLAALLSRATVATSPLWARAAPVFALVSCLLLNLHFYPGVNWLFVEPPLKALNAESRALLEAQYLPIRTATRYINATHPNARVLYPFEAPLGATLYGDPYYLIPWYAPARFRKANAIHNEDDIAQLFVEEGISQVLWDTSVQHVPGSRQWMLGQFLSRRGIPEFQAGPVISYSVTSSDLPYTEYFTLATPQQATAQALLLTGESGLEVHGARYARYSATFDCGTTSGYFIAQVNWSDGSAYYRPIACSNTPVRFAEAIPVPANVERADIYISVLDTPQATVPALSLEMN